MLSDKDSFQRFGYHQYLFLAETTAALLYSYLIAETRASDLGLTGIAFQQRLQRRCSIAITPSQAFPCGYLLASKTRTSVEQLVLECQA